MAASPYSRDDLLGFKPRHDAFVGIDSDGCVFDTMESKQKLCFHGLIVTHWGLERVEPAVRAAAEFVNLYSVWRGQNRFVNLLKTFELLREHPDVLQAGIPVPELASLRRFMASGAPLGNPELARAARETGDPELASLLKWSENVNAEIARKVKTAPAFPWALKSLPKIQARADAICVSQTPTEALLREWDHHNIRPYVALIAGQELGTKAEHLALATRGRYAPHRVLMIGDAPGDHAAAKQNEAAFYPINPGHEDASWQRFFEEAFDRFLRGAYLGTYEAELVREFHALLPETPPWQ